MHTDTNNLVEPLRDGDNSFYRDAMPKINSSPLIQIFRRRLDFSPLSALRHLTEAVEKELKESCACHLYRYTTNSHMVRVQKGFPFGYVLPEALLPTVRFRVSTSPAEQEHPLR